MEDAREELEGWAGNGFVTTTWHDGREETDCPWCRQPTEHLEGCEWLDIQRLRDTATQLLNAFEATEAARVALQQQVEELTRERDNAWGELGFTKNDLGNSRVRAERADADRAALRARVQALVEEWRKPDRAKLRDRHFYGVFSAIEQNLQLCADDLAAALARAPGDQD